MSDGRLVVLHSSKRWLRQTKTWIYQQLRWLPDSVEPHVVCDVTENLDQFPVRHLHTLERAPWWRRRAETVARRLDLVSLRFPVRVARRIGASILHSHFGPDGYAELSIARGAGLRHVVTFYGYDVTQVPKENPVWRSRYHELFSRVDRVLCEGPHMREELLRLGCPPEKAHVQHLGADLSLIRFEPRAWVIGEPLRVLIAGSFREKKGIPDAINALAAVVRERPELDLEVIVVGDAQAVSREQAEKSRILRTVAATGLSDRVRFLGSRPYADFLEQAYRSHIFLSPSVRASDGDTEGGAPVSIVELAASGMPIVSTTHCDIPNVLAGDASRLLAPERDPEALAARVLQLLDDPSSWAGFLSGVRSSIEARFDAAKQGESLARHYLEVMRS
jgi:colanic acid/amylovoran biosynthesis glycosyltransferase